MREKETQDLEQRLKDLEQSLNEQFQHKIATQASHFITPEDLGDKLATLKSEITRNVQAESKKAEEAHKLMFVT